MSKRVHDGPDVQRSIRIGGRRSVVIGILIAGQYLGLPTSAFVQREMISVSTNRRLLTTRVEEFQSESTVRIRSPESKQRNLQGLLKGEPLQGIEDTQEAIRVNLAKDHRTRRMVLVVQENVWCTRCRESGHFANECNKKSRLPVHYNPKEIPDESLDFG